MSVYEKAKSNVAKLNSVEFTQEERQSLYSQWKDEYDEDMVTVDYQGPRVTAENLAKYIINDRENKVVIDIAAGTGLVGEQLYKHGFRIMDALDPSQSMLDAAKQKGIYRNFICEFVTEKPLDIPDDSYDALTICGGMTNGHLKCEALCELIRLVKSGGYIVMVTKYSNLETVEEYKNRLEPLMDKIEKEGKWQKEKLEKFDNYYMGQDGVVIVYRVC